MASPTSLSKHVHPHGIGQRTDVTSSARRCVKEAHIFNDTGGRGYANERGAACERSSADMTAASASTSAFVEPPWEMLTRGAWLTPAWLRPGQEDRAGSDMTFLTLEETLKVGNLDEVFEDIRFGAESFHLNVLIMHWMLHWNVPIMHLNFAGHHGVDAGGVTAARVSTEHSSRLLHNRAGVGQYTHHPTIWSPSCCGRAHMCWHVYTVALVKLHTCFLYHTASLGVYEL